MKVLSSLKSAKKRDKDCPRSAPQRPRIRNQQKEPTLQSAPGLIFFIL